VFERKYNHKGKMGTHVVIQKLIFLILLVIQQENVQADRNTLSANVLSKYWIDARDVLEELDNYQALWIKVHGCV
jgi:hypothetical protein